ncbi:MAG: AMP-binding protein, partial [Actinobacteria bacterium]|nr:AMP-binding protein [Actinomycetota bacterium]
ELEAASSARPEPVANETDLAMLLCTSGSTGAPKACTVPHRTAIRMGEIHLESLGLRSTDVLFSPFPLFHVDAAILTVVPALLLGACAAIGQGFNPSTFWDEVRTANATVVDFMGDSLNLLANQPATAGDLENPLRLVWGAHVSDLALGAEFERRFELRLISNYGLTDAAIVAYQPLDQPARLGAAGMPVHPYDVRIFDEFDDELGAGEVGEIVVRSLEPWAMTTGYYGMPAATAARSRNLWFHTGDLGELDEDGYLHVRGRKSDEAGGQGAGVLLSDVEDVVASHPGVVESAAVRVATGATQGVKICVVPRAGVSLAADDIWAHCDAHLGAERTPRYLEIVAALPKTPTHKVEKSRLERGWLTPATVDRANASGQDLAPAPERSE